MSELSECPSCSTQSAEKKRSKVETEKWVLNCHYCGFEKIMRTDGQFFETPGAGMSVVVTKQMGEMRTNLNKLSKWNPSWMKDLPYKDVTEAWYTRVDDEGNWRKVYVIGGSAESDLLSGEEGRSA